jgi:hypothetical protein
MTTGRSSVRIQHVAAAGDIAREQNRKSAEKEQCRPQLSRSEIKPGVHDVNRDATYKDARAASICPESANESSEAKRKHVCQWPVFAAGIRGEKRR